MKPSFKRQRILDTRGQQRHSPGYDGPSRPYNPATFRQRLDANGGAIFDRNNGPTKFYEAVDAREGSPNFDDEESGEESYEEESPEADLQATRQNLDNRLKSTFEAIFEKYGKDFTGVGDEIDLRTGEIVVDNGHVAEMHAENDAGEGRGRGMLRAFTEEPEHARLPQQDAGDSEGSDEVDEDTDTEYHVRGRQMLRAFTQEPEFAQDAGTEEDENDYGGDTSKLDVVDEESDDDDILYQSSGVIPAKSMAPPPRPPICRPYQQKPVPTFRAPKPVQRPRLPSSSVAYPSEPDILAQFGHELGPRIAEYVSRPTSVDEGTIDPKWRTPALPAATAGKRPILKSMILQPETGRSPSPNGNSLWAPEKILRRRKRVANKMDKGSSGENEAAVRDRRVISKERVTSSGSSAEAAQQPQSAHIDAPEIPPRQYLVSENGGENIDDDSFDDNELVNSASIEGSAVEDSDDSEPIERKRRRPGSTSIPYISVRNRYTDEEDKQIIEWAKLIYNNTEYKVWSETPWNLLSKKNRRHTGVALRQRYRKFYDENGSQHPFLEPGWIQSMPPEEQLPLPEAVESSSADMPKLKRRYKTIAAGSFEPFKDIIHELYIEEGYNLTKVRRIMELKHGFDQHESQYKKIFKQWGFQKVAHLWDDPGYAGLTRTEAINRRRREMRKHKANQRERMATKGIPLLTPHPDEPEQVEARKAQRRERRLRRLALLEKKDQSSNPDHNEMEQRNDSNWMDDAEIDSGAKSWSEISTLHKGDTGVNTSTLGDAGKDGSSDGDDGLSGRDGSYDLLKLFQGASDYISPNSALAMEEDQAVKLPKNKGEHNHDADTSFTGRRLRSRVIPNSQSSQQDLMSPSTSQARQNQATTPTVSPRTDVLDSAYMFSDEEDETVTAVPPAHTSNPKAFSAAEPPNHQPLVDPAPLITPPTQESDIPPQEAPTDTLPTIQPEPIVTSVKIKDEPESIGRGLGDIYALPRGPPRLPTAPQPPASGRTLRVVTKQIASPSPLTSPAARTPTPPINISKTTPMGESTPRPSQKSLLGLSTSTPRRNHMERSTSRPRLTSRSAGSVRSRASMTPISKLAIRSPLRHDGGEGEDKDDRGDVTHSLSRSVTVGGGMSNLSVAGTPSRRSIIGSGSGGVSEDGDLIQTPGGAWRRCGESGYKCGRGFCFQCSTGGEGEVNV